MKKHFLSLLVLVLVIVSCGTYNEDDKKSFDTKIQSYIKKNKLEMEYSPSGLYYRIIEEGEGDFILYNDLVSFEYTGTLLDGTQFDKSEGAVEFKVNQLIAAWKETMSMLKPGGKAEIIAPPQLGYGDKDLDDIPPNSVLHFKIEVKSVK